MDLHYQSSAPGQALSETLDEMVATDAISPELARSVMKHFDRAMTDIMANQVSSKVAVKAKLDTYRLCDEVWTFLLKEGTFKFDNEVVQAKKVRIVATNAKKPADLFGS